MSSIDYHGGLEELGVACRLAHADIAFLKNPLVGIVIRGISHDSWMGRTLWKSGVFLRHLALPWRVLKHVRKRTVLLREFSSFPLLAISPLLLPMRNKIVLTVNHNMQWAMRSRGERFAFRMIDRLGFRFMFFEVQDQDGVRQLGLNSDRHWVIPHPVANREFFRVDHAPFTVGIVGHYRAEKGFDEALTVLLDNDKTSFRLIVGIPNMTEFKRSSRYGKDSSGFELRDTSAPEIYYATLAECDVVLLCYTSGGYRFRASGMVADAASCGAAVLLPDFPALRHQVESPALIGCCYKNLHEIPVLLDKMAVRLDEYQRNLPLYVAKRSAAALAGILNERIDE